MWAVVKAIGWEGAKEVCNETFTGWEVGFLFYALSMLADWERAVELDHQHRLLKQALGVSE